MKVYDRENVASSLQYGILIEALRKAFSSKITAPERVQHTIKNKNGSDATLLLMPAWKIGEHIGIKIVSVFPENTTNNMNAVHANYFLMNANDGKPVAVMDGTELTLRRTACASALAADYLVNKNVDTLLMIGTGNLAPHMIKAHCVVRNYSRILIWGRNEEKAERLALSLNIKDKEILAKNDLKEALNVADVISCATLTQKPLIMGDWIKPGQHLDLVGAFTPDMAEADSKAIAKSKVVVDTYEGALSESGELINALKEGRIKKEHILSDLRELVLEEKKIRKDSNDITLFKSVGTALEDLAAAELVIE
ncbi:MAG: ornithine cyclodeaminase family protein [Gammaproteobacteria bacterium]|nr:ornithine cyclodeaminase family protein [Gammaproteobacteria bacterium]